MNIISYFNQILKENFNKYLYNYFLDSNFWNKTIAINNYIVLYNIIIYFSLDFWFESLSENISSMALSLNEYSFK